MYLKEIEIQELHSSCCKGEGFKATHKPTGGVGFGLSEHQALFMLAGGRRRCSNRYCFEASSMIEVTNDQIRVICLPCYNELG